MCGIAAYLGSEQAYSLLTSALSKLEYRGYDSAGIALIDSDGDIHLTKTINKVASLSDDGVSSPLNLVLGSLTLDGQLMGLLLSQTLIRTSVVEKL